MINILKYTYAICVLKDNPDLDRNKDLLFLYMQFNTLKVWLYLKIIYS